MNKYLVGMPIPVGENTIPVGTLVEVDGLQIAWLDKDKEPILTFSFPTEVQFKEAIELRVLLPMQ